MKPKLIVLLIFILVLEIVLVAPMTSDVLILRRTRRLKCNGNKPCREFCDKYKQYHATPRCWQHRCYCAEPEAPMNVGWFYTKTTTTTTTEKPVMESSEGASGEGSGMFL
uniref:Defensin n=1 Tax=Caenorhabditis tropicalis TaxID=1561998 RepID=A0A1I7V1Q0_9PELO